MQKIKVICLIFLVIYTLTLPVAARDLFAIRTALTTPPEGSTGFKMSVNAGEILAFSARDIERRLSIREGDLRAITLVSTPSLLDGGLFVDGVLLTAFETLDRSEIDRLLFLSSETGSGTTFSFLPRTVGGAATVSLSIAVLPTVNHPPEIEAAVIETKMNVARTFSISAHDPDGDNITLQLIRSPENGTVTIDGLRLTYTPYRDMTGGDSFVIVAVDSHNAFSEEVVINVTVKPSETSLRYMDMAAHPSNYAALMLHRAGIWSGAETGSFHLFHPKRQMSRGEYLVLLISAAGLEHTITPTVNTGLPNDTQIPQWLKPHVSAGIRAGMIDPNAPFNHSEIPIRAEAVLMAARASDISGDFDLSFIPDAETIPQWAVRYYKQLAAYRMLDLHDGYARPNAALTNSYAADLIWQVYKYKQN